MKKIITAIGNEQIHNKLKQNKQIHVIGQDIQYKEGILEVLEKIADIDIIFIKEALPGNMTIYELIQTMQKRKKFITIIIYTKNKQKIETKTIQNIMVQYEYYEKNISIKQMMEKIEINHSQEEIKQEKFIKLDKKIISVVGSGGVGKSIVTTQLAQTLCKQNQKILLLDFDFLNHSLHTILGVNQFPNALKNKIKKERKKDKNQKFIKITIQDLILKVNKKIDIISGMDLLFNIEKKIDIKKLQDMILKIKEPYDKILIDTSCECFLEVNEMLLQISDQCLFVAQTNLLDIKKSKRLLDIYLERWGIPKHKFFIIFNKVNKNSIDDKILKNIFSGFPILGKLSFHTNYNLLINQHIRKKISPFFIQKEYEKIGEKLLKIPHKQYFSIHLLWKKIKRIAHIE